jgi:hypothetical protein
MSARLEEEIERLTQRVLALEAFLAPGLWDAPVPPLTLYQTRVMRLIAKRPVSGNDALRVMAAYYPATSDNALDSQMVAIRKALPGSIAPVLRRSKFCVLRVPDPAALAEFLATGVLPAMRRAA